MKKLIESVKCFFGFHDWSEPESFDFEVTRECKSYGRMERLHMGEWILVPRKNIKIL